MILSEQARSYVRSDSVVFRKTKDEFGGLSNMAPGFPLEVVGVRIPTSEALYQACRFPHKPEIQRLIIVQRSPMTAKMVGKPHRSESRRDWDNVRVKIMRWCLRVKLAQNWREFGDLLLSTGDQPIVEESVKDDFWGAKPADSQTLVGTNFLGRLLIELRNDLKNDSQSLKHVEPPGIPQFLLDSKPILMIGIAGLPIEPGPVTTITSDASQLKLFAENIVERGSADRTQTRKHLVEIDQPMNEKYAVKTRKKLIEVALPLEAINKASAREKSIRHGHPSTLHLWWSRKPLATARAVIFAQLVDDPSSHPEQFPTPEAQDVERQRLFRIIEELVLWENTTNEQVLEAAREEIRRSWRATCADNRDHPEAAELFNPDKLPAFHDPFAGGGSLPLEAQRLGFEAYASDLNPVAVLINKAMIEIPPKFAGRSPVNPESRKMLTRTGWHGASGLSDDVRYYGQWMRNEAEKRIGYLYPIVEITAEMAHERPDLKPLVGQKLTVIAWLWARTVKSPNPAFAEVDVPLASTFRLSTKAGKEAYVLPAIKSRNYQFVVMVGKPKDAEVTKNGTKLARGANFRCLMSDTPISGDYIKSEGVAGRLGTRLMAIVADGERGRVYLSPTVEMEAIARKAKPTCKLETQLPDDPRNFWTVNYGLGKFGDLFTPRQLVALTTFSDLLQEARDIVTADALTTGWSNDCLGLDGGGSLATAYAEAVCVYLSFAVDKIADRNSSIATWATLRESPRNTFGRQAIPMTWGFAETNLFSESSGNFEGGIISIVEALKSIETRFMGVAVQADAASQTLSTNKIVSTDPPYYDNIGYADLSDFFYIWLRRSLQPTFPSLFATLVVPKAEELVATPYRHGGKPAAEKFFLEGMTAAMYRLAEQAHPVFPMTIFYAFKQAETKDEGTTSTGWETFLEAVLQSGLALTGTWPIHTELGRRMLGRDTNVLASSIVLVCRPRHASAPTSTRREFLAALKTELPIALTNMQRGNIAPVDLAQASIGPGMAIYTRHAKVVNADGSAMTVREALAIINQTLGEVLAEQEGDFDADTRWALAWFEQSGFETGEYGTAETLSRAKDTSVGGMVEAGILVSKGGKVRLLSPGELPEDWDPASDTRLTAWVVVHQLIRALEADGEGAAAVLAAKLGSKAEAARELAYWLHNLCERKKWAKEALSYNGLVQSWQEIMRLAKEGAKGKVVQAKFGEDEEDK